MKKHLAESLSTVKANIMLILLLSLVSIYIFPGKMFLLAASSLVAQIFLYPAIYGRLIETLHEKPKTELFSLFKTHVWNYYAVILLFYVPFHIIFNAMSLIAVDHKQIQGFLAITHVSLQTLIAILLIYILPLIFLMRENISAIPLGLKFLFKNLTSSLLLIVLALMHTVIMHPVIKLGLPALLKINVQDNFMIFIAYAFFYNFVLFYINFMIFTAASKFLMKESHLKEQFKY